MDHLTHDERKCSDAYTNAYNSAKAEGHDATEAHYRGEEAWNEAAPPHLRMENSRPKGGAK